MCATWEAQAVIHDGIDDAGYITALKVLRRMVRNVSTDGAR